MVTETDRNKARSAVVSAYNTLDCVTIPFSFLHAFADAAVDAVSTDAEQAIMDDEDRTPMPAGFDDALWRKADEVHHAMALVARDQECVKIIYAALSTHNAEPVKTPFEIASKHIPEARVSLLSRAIRQGLDDYGWKNFGTLPEVLMGYIVEAERAEAAAHAEPVKTAPSVAVKALEWSNEDTGDFIAQSIVGWYHIGFPHLTWNLTTPDGAVPSFNDLKEAKAAAQADYESRIRSALSAQVQDVAGEPLELPYKNWRGEISTRKIQPIRLEFGATEWHPEPQWLLVATDVEKNAERSFALKDFNPQQTVSTVAGLESNPETLRWWCQQLLDIIENYDISHDACEEEIALLNDIRAAVDPASPASKHGDAE